MSTDPSHLMKRDSDRWDAIAKQYADWTEGNMGIEGKAFTTIVTDHILATIGDVHGKEVLDLGCGEGYLARELMHRGALVCAIDASPTMIEIAKSKDHLYNTKYIVGDITKELPYENTSFDLVVCNMVLMDLEDITLTMEEVARVLRPQARFIFSVVHPCFFNALGDWTDIDSPHPALHFKVRYTEQVKFMKQLEGFAPGSLVAHYNRPIQAYISPLIRNGFCISDFIETSFSHEYLEAIGRLKDLFRFHLTANNLIIGAVKMPDYQLSSGTRVRS